MVRQSIVTIVSASLDTVSEPATVSRPIPTKTQPAESLLVFPAWIRMPRDSATLYP
jgi:hypothetical protein